MIEDIMQDADSRMAKSIDSLSQELTKLRTGRAHPSLLDHVTVDYYGSEVPLNQAASVSVADGRTLAVSAWEKSMVPVIEKAILKSDLGLNPTAAGNVIRIPLPPLTEERRRELVRVVRHEGEAARVAIRNIRRDAIAHVKSMLKNKEIGEDEDRRAQDEIQRITDKYVRRVDDVLKDKEADLMEI